jgi:hypothetical protein
MLREKLKHILSLLRLSASVDAFLEAWSSSVHPLVGQITIHVSRCMYQIVGPDRSTTTYHWQ